MKKRELHHAWTPGIFLRLLGSVFALTLIFFLGISAVRFCLSLFLTGDYIIEIPGMESQVLYENSSVKPDPIPSGDDESQVVHARISVTGDIMTHMPVVRSAQTDDGYDFSNIFAPLSSYLEKFDYVVANLETTLSGTDNGNEYTGSPNFNAPDALASSARKAGFDLLLTGNEHCNDYGTYGLKRTLDILKKQELDTLGTTGTSSESSYIIRDLNGIQVGMISYTFADTSASRETPTVNGTAMEASAAGLLNCFDYNHLDDFYQEISTYISAMDEEGAEALVLYIHWGTEYTLTPSDTQQQMAQKLCDLGIDVIVGSHTHTVQPLALLTSTTDPQHTAICMYSVGNLISNQRANDSAMDSGHTEDGVLFSFTFAKYDDDHVMVDSIDLLPLWVLMQGEGANRSYRILPLEAEQNWKTLYQLTAEEFQQAQSSYSRTDSTLSESVASVQSGLDSLRLAKTSA